MFKKERNFLFVSKKRLILLFKYQKKQLETIKGETGEIKIKRDRDRETERDREKEKDMHGTKNNEQ